MTNIIFFCSIVFGLGFVCGYWMKKMELWMYQKRIRDRELIEMGKKFDSSAKPQYHLGDIVHNFVLSANISKNGNLALLMSEVYEESGRLRTLFFCDKEKALEFSRWIQETFSAEIDEGDNDSDL